MQLQVCFAQTQCHDNYYSKTKYYYVRTKHNKLKHNYYYYQCGCFIKMLNSYSLPRKPILIRCMGIKFSHVGMKILVIVVPIVLFVVITVVTIIVTNTCVYLGTKKKCSVQMQISSTARSIEMSTKRN